MSKYDTVDEMLMELELNTKVFKDDPLKKNINRISHIHFKDLRSESEENFFILFS